MNHEGEELENRAARLADLYFRKHDYHQMAEYLADDVTLFFASTFWRKMQNIFGECCISKLEKVARPRLAAILPAT